MRRRADAAGHLRFGLPKELGGQGGSNLAMAIIREHLATKGNGLHNDLQNESSVVGNFPTALMLLHGGTEEQKEQYMEGLLTGGFAWGFGLTEPGHGSDATHLETTARRDGDEYVINGAKRWNTGLHVASHDLIFARTSGEPGEAAGITCFIVPVDAPGFLVEEFLWTFNMPTDHADVSLTDVRVPASAILGEEGRGLALAQLFVHENRIRQAASGVGAAQYCINESVGLQQGAGGLRQAAVAEPGDPVPARRAADRDGDDPGAGARDRMAPRRQSPHGRHGQGLHV